MTRLTKGQSTADRRPTWRTRSSAVAAVLSIALVAAACGGSESGGEAATDAGGGDNAVSGFGEQLDASVLTGTATTLSGETFDIANLAGQDAIVWFWAPW